MPAKIRSTLLSLALLVSGQIVSLPAQATTSLSQLAPIAQPQIASGSAMIVDLTTNKVLFSSHPDRV
ncbi:MAG: D-alanyl-D-alanine endopeptidase, partial [Pantoea agglomerans]